MSDRRFRFGVVAGQVDGMAQWGTLVRRVEDAGFDTLLTPDTFNVAAPFTALASAATISPRLRLGTFVLVAPLRTSASIAWESASIDRLSGGRFELGLGAGRPDAEGEARLFGLPWGTPGERVARLAEAIRDVREIFAAAHESAGAGGAQRGPGGNGYLRPDQVPHPPIMVAGHGAKILGLAAREADIVAIGLPGDAGEDQLGEKVAVLRAAAGDRFDRIELNTNVFGVGDGELPPWLRRFGVDPATARDNRSIAVLNGDPGTIADVLLRRRDRFGVSYVTVSGQAFEAFAPVIEKLAGR